MWLGNIFGYLRKYPDGAIRFRTHIPDHESVHGIPRDIDWAHSVYADAVEEIPDNAPVPKGKPVRQTSFFDASLAFCHASGASAMGDVHLVNGTPVAWKSTKIPTVETSTYATELIAHRACADEIAAIRYELRMLGAPIDGPAWVFGDNESEINGTGNPAGRLKKRHLMLAFHRVRQMHATILHSTYIPSGENLADVLTKSTDHNTLWHLIRPVLFWKGDPAESLVPKSKEMLAKRSSFVPSYSRSAFDQPPGSGEYQRPHSVLPVGDQSTSRSAAFHSQFQTHNNSH